MQQELKKKIDQQINRELYSAYLYQYISLHFAENGWNGFAHWTHKQAHEELEHAEEIMKYLISRGEKPELTAVEQPKLELEGVLEIFEKIYKHECYISSSINELVTLSIKEADYASEGFFKKFVREQVEEEDIAAGIVQRLKLCSNNAGFMIVDGELGRREK